jgi:hypothetical protein
MKPNSNLIKAGFQLEPVGVELLEGDGGQEHEHDPGGGLPQRHLVPGPGPCRLQHPHPCLPTVQTRP